MHPILSKINIAVNPRTPIQNFFEFMIGSNSSTKRPELLTLIKGMSLDKAFGAMSQKYFNKNPFHLDPEERQDMIIDALHAVVTKKTIDAYDPTKAPFIGYFGRMFELRLINELKAYTQRKTIERDNYGDGGADGESDEEHMDRMNSEPSGEDIEHAIQYKQLVQQLDAFIRKQPNGDRIAELLPMLISGESSGDIAKALGISPGAVSQWLKKLKEYIEAYAVKTKNALLLKLIQGLSNQRRHADGDSAFFLNLFKQYKKVRSEDETSPRTPVGQVSRITIKSIPDMMSDEFRTQTASNPAIATSELEAELDGLIAELRLADDVLETGPGKLSLLRVDAKSRGAL